MQSYYFTADAKKWLNLTKEKKDILSIVDKPSWFNQLYIYSYTLNNLRTGPSPISNLWPSFLFRNPLRLSYYDLRSYWRFFFYLFYCIVPMPTSNMYMHLYMNITYIYICHSYFINWSYIYVCKYTIPILFSKPWTLTSFWSLSPTRAHSLAIKFSRAGLRRIYKMT